MELFKGDNSLILGFNAFLPPGCKIELHEIKQVPPPPPVEIKPAIDKNENIASKMDFEQAIKFVTKIKVNFEKKFFYKKVTIR
jgi:histone deacetylase complex regulatory component SIN3